jgi:hypothetical protein
MLLAVRIWLTLVYALMVLSLVFAQDVAALDQDVGATAQLVETTEGDELDEDDAVIHTGRLLPPPPRPRTAPPTTVVVVDRDPKPLLRPPRA